MPRSRVTTVKTMSTLNRATYGDIDLSAPCVAVLPDGDVCGREPIGNGAPVDLCPAHARALFQHMQNLLREAPFINLPAQINPTRFGNPSPGGVRTRSDAEHMNGWPAVVYYLAAEQHIKIGTTTNLRRRLHEYPPCARLLAVEPGSIQVEKRRLSQFAEHRVSAKREWFEPGDDLMSHVHEVAARDLPPGPLVTGVPAPAELTS